MVSIPPYFGVLKIAYIVVEVSCLRHTKARSKPQASMQAAIYN